MNWPEIFKGVQLCIGIQLLVIAGFKLASSQKRNRLLGFYTILASISSLSGALFDFIADFPFLHVLFGAHLILFHAPLLFLYIKAIQNEDLQVRSHLYFPVFYIVAYLVVKHVFADFFEENSFQFLILHLSIVVVYTGAYFYFGTQYFSRKLKDSLKNKALKKFRLFYYVANIHAISLNLVTVGSYVLFLYFYDEFPVLNENIVPSLLSFIIYVHPVSSLIFMIYVLSETNRFQVIMLDKSIEKSASFQENIEVISKEIRRVFEEEKKYKNPDFTLKKLSSETGVNVKDLSAYFNEELSTSFNDYLNRHRIDEFKKLLRADGSSTYSLVGLAQESGFKSKATFYRVFKEMEGMTPANFKKEQVSI